MARKKLDITQLLSSSWPSDIKRKHLLFGRAKKQPSVKSLKLKNNKINLRLGCVLILTLRDLSKRAVAVTYRLDLIEHDKVN